MTPVLKEYGAFGAIQLVCRAVCWHRKGYLFHGWLFSGNTINRNSSVSLWGHTAGIVNETVTCWQYYWACTLPVLLRGWGGGTLLRLLRGLCAGNPVGTKKMGHSPGTNNSGHSAHHFILSLLLFFVGRLSYLEKRKCIVNLSSCGRPLPIPFCPTYFLQRQWVVQNKCGKICEFFPTENCYKAKNKASILFVGQASFSN